MREDDLLEGITEVLELGGWRWTHTRRSDLAVMQGTPGVPDLFAVRSAADAGRGGHFLALELKSDHGQPTAAQSGWLVDLARAGIDARLVYPEDYDALIVELVGDRLQRKRRR